VINNLHGMLKITNRSFITLHLVSGISSLCLFVNLILVPVTPSPTRYFTRHFFLFWFPLCSSVTPSLFHSWLKTYLFHKSYTHTSTSSSRTTPPSWTIAWPFLLSTRFLLSTHADRQGVDISVTVCVCVCACTVTDFTGEDKASGVKFCAIVHWHPGQGISHSGELCSPRNPKSDE